MISMKQKKEIAQNAVTTGNYEEASKMHLN